MINTDPSSRSECSSEWQPSFDRDTKGRADRLPHKVTPSCLSRLPNFVFHSLLASFSSLSLSLCLCFFLPLSLSPKFWFSLKIYSYCYYHYRKRLSSCKKKWPIEAYYKLLLYSYSVALLSEILEITLLDILDLPIKPAARTANLSL